MMAVRVGTGRRVRRHRATLERGESWGPARRTPRVPQSVERERGGAVGKLFTRLVLTSILLAVAALIVFLLLGGSLGLSVRPGDIDIRWPWVDTTVERPKVDVEPGNLEFTPPRVDVQRADSA